jgi:U3 small nucleolar RNA-associated protein 15
LTKRDTVKGYKYFYRGQYEKKLEDGDITALTEKKKRLQDYDIFLKKFQYHNALDCVLKRNEVEVIMSVIEELIDRNALKIALLNRSEEDLEILLNFIFWKIRDPKTMNVLLYVFNLLVDFYKIAIGHNSKINELFRKINEAIQQEIKFENDLREINNTIDSINSINYLLN